MTPCLSLPRPACAGDAYIASTGCVPGCGDSSAEDALKLARLAVAMQAHCAGFIGPDGEVIRMRVGIVTGPAMGGVVGTAMLR